MLRQSKNACVYEGRRQQVRQWVSGAEGHQGPQSPCMNQPSTGASPLSLISKHTHWHTDTHRYTREQTHIHRNTRKHTHIQTQKHTHAHTDTQVNRHIHRHTRNHTYILTQKHRHAHTHDIDTTLPSELRVCIPFLWRSQVRYSAKQSAPYPAF